MKINPFNRFSKYVFANTVFIGENSITHTTLFVEGGAVVFRDGTCVRIVFHQILISFYLKCHRFSDMIWIKE